MILKEVRMESTISAEDVKAKLDRKDPVKVVETLAPERYREAHLPGALNISPEQIKELAPQLLPNRLHQRGALSRGKARMDGSGTSSGERCLVSFRSFVSSSEHVCAFGQTKLRASTLKRDQRIR
jgi:3-mercaptopyruvate sulfurtransferase SseA